MDVILHLIGICHDTQMHFDLLDLLATGGAGAIIMGRYAISRLFNKES